MVSLREPLSWLWVHSPQRAYCILSSVLRRRVHLREPPLLCSYKSACRSDPDVRKLDDLLRTRTRRIFSDLAERQRDQHSGQHGVSLNSVKEVTTSLLETDQDGIKIILEHKDDVMKDPALFDLVQEFLEASVSTSEFCDTTLSSIRRAKDNHSFVEKILDRMPSGREPTKNELEEMQKEMQNFRDASNPFSRDLINSLMAVRERHKKLLPKLRQRRNNLQHRARVWRKLTSVMLATAVTAIVICSVMATAMASPQQPIAYEFLTAAATSSSSTDAFRSVVESLWITHEKEITDQHIGIVQIMEESTFEQIQEIETIRTQLEMLQSQLESISYDMEFAEARKSCQGTLKIAVNDLKKKNEPFLEDLQDLEKHTSGLQGKIHHKRDEVLTTITQCRARAPFCIMCCGDCKNTKSSRFPCFSGRPSMEICPT